MTTLETMLNVKYPVIQAPMAGVQDHRLAVAVSNAGGLGSLPCATLTHEQLREELTALRQETDKPYNLNFFTHTPIEADAQREAAWRELLAPYYREFGLDISEVKSGPGRAPFSAASADLIEQFRPAVVSFHFGLPPEGLLARVKSSGAKVLASATTVAEAQWLEQRGVDAIIAQGLEAGGHRGIFLSEDLSTQLGLFALLPQIVQAVKVPVIAAGGIANVEGVRAALALGAAGVQVGTAYLLTPEATTSKLHRAALMSERARHTALTNLFTGRPARGIMNRIMREHGPLSNRTPAFPLATSALAPLRTKAEAQGKDDFSQLWSGENANLCKEISAADLTLELAAAFR